MNNTNAYARPVATLPQRKTQPLPTAERLPFRVLQGGQSPAQLSLFLRPGLSVKR